MYNGEPLSSHWYLLDPFTNTLKIYRKVPEHGHFNLLNLPLLNYNKDHQNERPYYFQGSNVIIDNQPQINSYSWQLSRQGPQWPRQPKIWHEQQHLNLGDKYWQISDLIGEPAQCLGMTHKSKEGRNKSDKGYCIYHIRGPRREKKKKNIGAKRQRRIYKSPFSLIPADSQFQDWNRGKDQYPNFKIWESHTKNKAEASNKS